MKSPSHFLKCKLKNATHNNNINNNFQIKINYVSNIVNTIESSFRENINKSALKEQDNICINKEISALSNFKFLKNDSYRNSYRKSYRNSYRDSFSKNTSSGIKNRNLKKKKKFLFFFCKYYKFK